MSAYQAWSVVFGEQPSAAKWNILGQNDASFNDGSGFASGALGSVHSSLVNGLVVQVVNTTSSAVATGTTAMPPDDTIPQNTEGDEFMTLAITPKSATNILVIEVFATVASNTANKFISGALFQDSTANALAAGILRAETADGPYPLVIRHAMVAATTSATTFKFRAGANTATLTFNGTAGGRLFGAIPKSSIVIYEYKAS